LLLYKEERGLLEGLVLEVLGERLRHIVTYREVNTSNQSINATNMCYMDASKERGSDSKNFGTRITGFGVVVEKI
jgi:hypothetical protein